MKPSLPKGTRDFSSKQVAKRNYLINAMKVSFETYGFQPIETPSFENYSTLMGKYGDEGDRLIFKILNSGDFLKKVTPRFMEERNSSKLTSEISEKALRYDLTVPFARYVVQHQNEIIFPFKRYQIQPVWRADRPQKGRFREFFQCDADVVGSQSLLQEIDFIQLYDAVFTNLKLFGTQIKINHRKILAGIAEVIGAKEKLTDFTVALDKLDKIGKEAVEREMLEKGIALEAIKKVRPLFELSGSSSSQFAVLQELLQDSKQGIQGVEELRFIVRMIDELGLQSASLEIDVTLARGLHYYTGAIFEVLAPQGVQMGSIGGGGRYDNLTGIFGLKNMSGIGISFGFERIYLVMNELGIFPETLISQTQVLFTNFGEKAAKVAYSYLTQLRNKNITCELYPSEARLKKQLNYANSKGIQKVILIGSEELKKNSFILKNMSSGEQTSHGLPDLINLFN